MSIDEEINDADPPFFAENEKILVFHGPLLYEGKILKVAPARHETGERLYVIHYSGWSKKWDEKVPESRVLKYNDENLKRQKEHKMAFESSSRGTAGKKSELNKSSGGAGGKPSASAPSTKNTLSIAGDSVSNVSVTEEPGPSIAAGEESSNGTKDKAQTPLNNYPIQPEMNAKKKKLLETSVESEVKYANKQVIEFPMPDKLRILLLTDFDMINRQKQLMKLPGRHTVDSLLEGYGTTLESDPSTQKPQLLFVEGLKDTFNSMLGGQLLYRFERQQYAGFIKTLEDKDPNITEEAVIGAMSGIYGPIHLIRLFTKLGSSLAFTDIDQARLALFKKYAQHLYEYITSKEDEFFHEKDDYGMAEPQYQRNEPV